jgi:hypothetical protein
VVSMVMDHRAADDDVGESYTPRPPRNGTPVKGRWGGGSLDISLLGSLVLSRAHRASGSNHRRGLGRRRVRPFACEPRNAP